MFNKDCVNCGCRTGTICLVLKAVVILPKLAPGPQMGYSTHINSPLLLLSCDRSIELEETLLVSGHITETSALFGQKIEFIHLAPSQSSEFVLRSVVDLKPEDIVTSVSLVAVEVITKQAQRWKMKTVFFFYIYIYISLCCGKYSPPMVIVVYHNQPKHTPKVPATFPEVAADSSSPMCSCVYGAAAPWQGLIHAPKAHKMLDVSLYFLCKSMHLHISQKENIICRKDG